MKIGAIADLHGTLPTIEPCDVLLIAGDIAPLDIQTKPVALEMWLRSEFVNWVKNLPCEHVITVWGNHDYPQPAIEEVLSELTKGKIEFLNNVYTNVMVGDESITIWGSPWCKIFFNWSFNATDEKLEEYYSKMPKNCDIVLTHDSPAAGDMGVITEGSNKGHNAGNKVLAKYIKDRQPKYAISGHIHSSNHNLTTKRGYGQTKFATVSILDENYQHSYKPLYFEV